MPTKRKAHPATMRAINTVIDHLSQSYVRTPQARNLSIPKALTTISSTTKRLRHHKNTIHTVLTPDTTTAYLKAIFESRYTVANTFLQKNNRTVNADITAMTSLLSHGADPNVEIYNGVHWTRPLIQSIESRHPKIAHLLIQHGANINVIDMNGRTPLMHAIRTRNVDLAMELIQRGANLRIRDRTGHTAWDYAVDLGSVPLLTSLWNTMTNEQ